MVAALLMVSLCGNPRDSALSAIRAAYAKIQAEIQAKSCFQDSSGAGLAVVCPSGGQYRSKEEGDSGTTSSEWYLDKESAMFAYFVTRLPGGRTEERRIYRLPGGVKVLVRKGPAKRIQGQPQLDDPDTGAAGPELRKGFDAWAGAGVFERTFPFFALTVEGMAVVDQQPGIEAAKAPVVSLSEAKWTLRIREVPAAYRQFLGATFREVESGRSATLTGFALYTKRTPHFGEFQREQNEEEMLEAVVAAKAPMLVAEFSSPLKGVVHMDGFPPATVSSAIPERFEKRANRLFQERIDEVDAEFKAFLEENPDQGGATDWESYANSKTSSAAYSTPDQAIILKGVSSGEDCSNAAFTKSLDMGYGLRIHEAEEEAKARRGKKPGRALSRGELSPGMLEIENPCDPFDCEIQGEAFIPWNRSTIHIHKVTSPSKEEVIELDGDFQWQSRELLEIPALHGKVWVN